MPAVSRTLVTSMTVKTRKQQIEEMLVETPDDPELRYMLAMEHASAGDDPAAVLCFEEIIRRQPDYPPAYHMAGRALQHLSRFTEARQILERGIPIAMQQGNPHAAGEMQELLDNLE